jgi:predicted PurR-regulated permease PerM
MSSAGPFRSYRFLFLGCSAVLFMAAIVAAREVMLPFILAVLIAYVLTPLVSRVERWRVRRGLAVLIVYVVVLGSLAGFIRGVSPRIALEVKNLQSELPALASEARDKWVPALTERLRAAGLAPPEVAQAEPPESAAFVVHPQADGSFAIDVGTGVNVIETKGGFTVEPAHDKKSTPLEPGRILADFVGRSFAYARENSLEVARVVRQIVSTVSRAIFVFFITLMLAAYLMVTRERVHAFVRSLVTPRARASFDTLLARTDAGLSGVVRGQLLICGINGVLSAVGFAIIGLKYWPVMALVAAIFSLIPIFGSIASAVPAVAIGLTQGFPTAIFVLAWILGIHQLEANLLNPKIMGDAAKIHPVLVIFSLLAGEHFFHIVGALLAVPTMSIAQSLFLHFRDVIDERDEKIGRGETPT